MTEIMGCYEKTIKPCFVMSSLQKNNKILSTGNRHDYFVVFRQLKVLDKTFITADVDEGKLNDHD